MTRKELYKKLDGKRIACVGNSHIFKDVGIFKRGRMSFTINHIQPLKRMEYLETKYFLYKEDTIYDLGTYILIRRNAVNSSIFIFVA